MLNVPEECFPPLNKKNGESTCTCFATFFKKQKDHNEPAGIVNKPLIQIHLVF